MTGYSQSGEDVFLTKYFRGKTNGRFLDIGAYHPTELSNTRALYDMGWSGVMIEPSPGPFQTLLDAYGNDDRIQLVLAAVGLESGLLKLHACDGPVTTAFEEERKRWEGEYSYRGAFWIPKITFADIVRQFGGFDFINIDAEGLSIELFFHVPLDAMLPSAVCVEHNEQRLVELGNYAQKHHYHQAWISQENAIFVRA